ncbi:ribonuclease H [Ignicoccus hospitalis KIN4/I]|uniref:Ribonuclease H n=1 Tax=Ignicoccus hospitalis (strain KIN4/I / DSM 18386 / JCM 14125) TaxID=453591 RepID=A8ABM8_IGNH4|nr:ribonuclease H [Ignicoccus hospitalis KIN4/I]
MSGGKSRRLELYFDGLCEPVNPGGVATYGFVVKEGGKVLCSGKGLVGVGARGDDVTNNVAEYTALIKALECLLEKGLEGAEVVVKGDSQLAIRQLRGEYKVRSPRIAPLYKRAKELLSKFKAELQWVPRELNEEADALSREAFREYLEANKEEFERYYLKSSR